MAHRTFFSFHYEQDVWRSSIVRNSGLLGSGDKSWIEASIWEATKLRGKAAVSNLILGGLKNTSVTAVLIGSHTAQRPWVKYEIDQSILRGNGLFGIRINNIKDNSGNVSTVGNNPLPVGYKIYDWILNDGYKNLGYWVDAAYDAR